MDDFKLQLKREVHGETTHDWKTYDFPLFKKERALFEHPLLEEVALSYPDGVVMRFRKEPT